MKISFYEWISIVGIGSGSHCKLGMDIGKDPTAPSKADTLKEWQDYLKSKNACDKAMKNLEEYWATYRNRFHREPYHDY